MRQAQCSSAGAPQHFLNFLPLPQGQGRCAPPWPAAACGPRSVREPPDDAAAKPVGVHCEHRLGNLQRQLAALRRRCCQLALLGAEILLARQADRPVPGVTLFRLQQRLPVGATQTHTLHEAQCPPLGVVPLATFELYGGSDGEDGGRLVLERTDDAVEVAHHQRQHPVEPLEVPRDGRHALARELSPDGGAATAGAAASWDRWPPRADSRPSCRSPSSRPRRGPRAGNPRVPRLPRLSGASRRLWTAASWRAGSCCYHRTDSDAPRWVGHAGFNVVRGRLPIKQTRRVQLRAPFPGSGESGAAPPASRARGMMRA